MLKRLNVISTTVLSMLIVASLAAMETTTFERREHTVKKLDMARQAEVSSRQSKITRMLFDGVFVDKEQMVQAAIKKGAHLHARRYGLGALHWAVLLEHIHVVPCLIKAGVDLNARINRWSKGTKICHYKPGDDILGPKEMVNGVTALHVAVAQQDFFLTYCLLVAGADAFAKDSRDQTPYDWAKQNGWLEVFRAIDKAAIADRNKGLEDKDLSEWIAAFNHHSSTPSKS